MRFLTESQLWDTIVNEAGIGQEAAYLDFTRHEFKRAVIFLRKLQDIDIPPEVIRQLRESALHYDYQLRVTGKWATMADLQFAVGDVTWLWKDWIPKDMLTLLAGDPGTGKSQLALWFCKLVAEGLLWPNREYNNPEPVIFVDAEAAQVITKERCINMDIPLDRVFVPNLGNDMLAQPDLSEESHREQLANMVEEVKPALIVIDSMGGIKSGGENKKEEMQPIMLYLTRLVQNRNCGILVLHHLNKTKREEHEEIALANLRGSSVIAQFARSVMFVSTKPQGTKLWVGKSNIAKLAPPLRVDPRIETVANETVIKGFDFSLWSEDIKLTKIEECQRWVLQYLAGQDLDTGIAARQVFDAGDEMWTIRTVKDAGTVLENRGLIRRSGGKNSVWRVLQPMLREANHEESENEDLGEEEERTQESDETIYIYDDGRSN